MARKLVLFLLVLFRPDSQPPTRLSAANNQHESTYVFRLRSLLGAFPQRLSCLTATFDNSDCEHVTWSSDPEFFNEPATGALHCENHDNQHTLHQDTNAEDATWSADPEFFNEPVSEASNTASPNSAHSNVLTAGERYINTLPPSTGSSSAQNGLLTELLSTLKKDAVAAFSSFSNEGQGMTKQPRPDPIQQELKCLSY
eukprot:c53966_g1_i1 orf=283-879(+)